MPTSHVTQVLQDIAAGAAHRQNELYEALYGELHRIARAHIARERSGHMLQTTALIHEAWIKLVDQKAVPSNGRSHFLSVASQAMRRILCDHARSRGRMKRGGGAEQVEFENVVLAESTEGDVDLVALDAALKDLATRSARQARIVEMRFFGGLTAPQIAEALGVSLSTIEREWRFARVWLLSKL